MKPPVLDVHIYFVSFEDYVYAELLTEINIKRGYACPRSWFFVMFVWYAISQTKCCTLPSLWTLGPAYQEILYLSRNTPELPIEKLMVLFQNIFSVMYGIP